MMRSMKKRKFTETHSIFSSENHKKLKKNDRNHLPIPEYIKIVDGLLEYHFASKKDAKDFCRTLTFVESDLNEKIETDGLCVKLSEGQFNRWLQKSDAYKIFTHIDRILNESGTEKVSLINDMLDEKLANQVALLNSPTIAKPLYSAIILADSKSFMDFYAKLSTETLNTVALRKDGDDANILMLIVSFQSLQFGNILKRVN